MPLCKLTTKIACALLLLYVVGFVLLALVLIPQGLLGAGASTELPDYIFFLDGTDAAGAPQPKPLESYLFLLIVGCTLLVAVVGLLLRLLMLRVELRASKQQFRATQHVQQTTVRNKEKQQMERVGGG